MPQHRILEKPILAVGRKQNIGSYPNRKDGNSEQDGPECLGTSQVDHVSRENPQHYRKDHHAERIIDGHAQWRVLLQRQKDYKNCKWQYVGKAWPACLE